MAHLYGARDVRGEGGVYDNERFARQRGVRQTVAAPVRTDSTSQLRQTPDRLDRLVRADLLAHRRARTRNNIIYIHWAHSMGP